MGRYYNGGDLKSFIQEHFDYFDEASDQATRRNVPGHFIWHVAEQIGEALVYMHLGLPYGASGPDACTLVEGWVPIYHRNICDSNIFLDYPETTDSKLEILRAQAFPRVVLGGWGVSAIQGDDPELIQHGTPPASSISPELAEWTDVHQFGCVLRLLCMAHVDLDVHSPDVDEEGDDAFDHDLDVDMDGEIWERDRPDSQTLENCNEYGEEKVYSSELIRLLKNFERPGMDTNPVLEQIQHVPTVSWIASTLLPLARKRLQQLKNPARPTVDYFSSLDVSWTKPSDPVPP